MLQFQGQLSLLYDVRLIFSADKWSIWISMSLKSSLFRFLGFFFFFLWQSHYNYTLFKMLDITSALNVSSLSKSITLTLKTWLCFWMTPFCLLYLHLHWETWKHFQISIFFFLTSDVQSVFKLPSNPSSLTGRFYITDLTTGILHNR